MTFLVFKFSVLTLGEAMIMLWSDYPKGGKKFESNIMIVQISQQEIENYFLASRRFYNLL